MQNIKNRIWAYKRWPQTPLNNPTFHLNASFLSWYLSKDGDTLRMKSIKIANQKDVRDFNISHINHGNNISPCAYKEVILTLFPSV